MNFEDYETLPTQSSVTHMTAGAIAGIMEHCIMYPLDSVKTRMQSLRSAHNSTITETFRYMVRTEGLLRPVRGMSAVVMGAGPAHACFFATYEQAKHTLSQLTRHRHDHITHGLSGCLASVIHDAVSNPTEVIKQRLQMLNSPYRGVWECARRVYRTEGLRAFYRSYGTQLAMNVPFQSLHFVTYEWCQSVVNPRRGYDPRAHALSGAAAGALAAAATTPLDVCKTVLNTQEKTARADGLAEAAGHILRVTGPLGFFKGVQARILYQMPAAAICWLTYETLKHLLVAKAERQDDLPPAATAPTPLVAPDLSRALRLAAADVPAPLTRT
ncbi:mitoferrin-1 [Plutella xylostella]|uniref:mitoferrin-1 n=1 Tax=Plutella xylostella TaxID=51655 RepID=UPI0005D08633|nr:mitoferrin-1 [Plutella xylostella]